MLQPGNTVFLVSHGIAVIETLLRNTVGIRPAGLEVLVECREFILDFHQHFAVAIQLGLCLHEPLFDFQTKLLFAPDLLFTVPGLLVEPIDVLQNVLSRFF